MKNNYDIKSIDFSVISNPAVLYDELAKTIELPNSSVHNGDAFWNAITGNIKMPSTFIIYNIQEYEKRHPKDAQQLIRIYFNFNKLENRNARILLDRTEDLEDYNGSNFNLIFKKRPTPYGYRGDPHLWTELENYFTSKPMPENEVDLVTQIHEAIEIFIGETLSSQKPLFVNKYDSGGMSSGRISSEFWINIAIPILIGRYRQIR